MKYWTFDVVQLIADYPENQKKLAAILEAKRVALGYLENPVGATSRGDWEQYLKILELRENEYQLYVDMVIMGINDLPEIERQILKWWLIDGYDDSTIISSLDIKNGTELNKLKKMALTRFTNLVMPN